MSTEASPSKLWLETPLIPSTHISHLLGHEYSVYLKLENLQPPHSFKYRGLSLFIQRKFAIHGPSLHVICPSGGNAGFAAAYASQAIGVKCTIYLPEGVAQSTRDYLRKLGAEVVVIGKFYLEAKCAAEEAAGNSENAVFAPAYEDPILWEGHASMVKEIKTQLPDSTKPDAIFCSVGGGGLLGGLVVGCKDVGWDDVPIIALETHGSNCFYQSIAANRSPLQATPEGITVRDDDEHDVKIAHVHHLRSKATSLGASEPAAGVVKMALQRKGGVRCVTVPDALSMQTARSFAEDHKMLVELACSTALAPAYKRSLLLHLVPLSGPNSERKRTLVFIVCGGFKISESEMEEYRRTVAGDVAAGGEWDVMVDGEKLTVQM